MGGMARFRQLDDRLREQSDLLFSSSANARKPKINSLIREIQAAEREYEQARFSNRDYTGLREEIEEHESLAERLRIDWDDQRPPRSPTGACRGCASDLATGRTAAQ